MKKTAISFIALFAVPYVAFAQNLAPLQNLVSSVNSIVGRLIPLLIAVAMVVFFWGLIKYVKGAKKSAAQGKGIMIAGLVTLFVMVSVWGIVRLAQGSLGITGNEVVPLPAVPTANGASNPSSPSYNPLRPLPGATSGPETFNRGASHTA